MSNKYFNKVAVCSYATFFISSSIFGIQFLYEGWSAKGFKPMLNPLGFVFIGIAIFAVALFIWNIRREELSPDELVKKRDERLPDLLLLKDEIGKYIKTTHEISKNDGLYPPDNLSSTPLLMLINNNDEYLKLKIDGAVSLVDSINLISVRLRNSKLDKLINQTFQDEHKARSQQIVIRLFRNNYPHSKRNERKLLEVESQLRKANNVRKFAKTLKKLYSHIEMMEIGGDLWTVNTANRTR